MHHAVTWCKDKEILNILLDNGGDLYDKDLVIF